MTPDASAGAAAASAPQSTPEVSLELQVRLKTEDGQLLLLLPPETNTEPATGAASTWTELWQQLKVRLNAGERFWQPNAEVQLMGSDRLLDIRQLQSIADALSEVDLQLKRVHTSRRQTAVAACCGASEKVNQIARYFRGLLIGLWGDFLSGAAALPSLH